MKHIAALVADMIDDAIKQMNTMKNTLEFEIPEGYEIDEEKSKGRKVVYKKVEKYEPKEGDLVYAECGLSPTQKFIFIYGVENTCSIDNLHGRWEVEFGNHWLYHIIRPATSEEAALFTRILAENGYEYDPENKEVRKKRWRAAKGGCYWYASIYGGVCDESDERYKMDDDLYSIGNYFRTREEAEEVAAEFRKILDKRK